MYTRSSAMFLGIYYVPPIVYKSKWFWILLFVMVVAIIIYHNAKRTSKNSSHMAKRLTYFNQGRGGTVVYADSVSSIKLDFEFGGGNCVAIIFIPSKQTWENITKRTLAERDQIVEFIARQSLKDQVAGGRYEIKEQYIEFYSKA